MKVYFCFVLAFAVVLLAESAKTQDKPKAELNAEPKAEPKLENSQKSTEEKNHTVNSGEGDKQITSQKEEVIPAGTPSENSTAASISAEQRCSDIIGQFVNGKFVGLKVEYDLKMLLEKYGGPPGKVNATWTEKEDAPVEKENSETRPLRDADEKYWLYKYGDSDGKTYIRIEHAVRRWSGTPKAFLEIRGTLYFTPDDFCGKSRRALYTVDDRGFTFEVTHEYCWIGELVSCANPAHCTTDEQGNINSCVAAPSNALLAALVGGGK